MPVWSEPGRPSSGLQTATFSLCLHAWGPHTHDLITSPKPQVGNRLDGHEVEGRGRSQRCLRVGMVAGRWQCPKSISWGTRQGHSFKAQVKKQAEWMHKAKPIVRLHACMLLEVMSWGGGHIAGFGLPASNYSRPHLCCSITFLNYYWNPHQIFLQQPWHTCCQFKDQKAGTMNSHLLKNYRFVLIKLINLLCLS